MHEFDGAESLTEIGDVERQAKAASVGGSSSFLTAVAPHMSNKMYHAGYYEPGTLPSGHHSMHTLSCKASEIVRKEASLSRGATMCVWDGQCVCVIGMVSVWIAAWGAPPTAPKPSNGGGSDGKQGKKPGNKKKKSKNKQLNNSLRAMAMGV